MGVALTAETRITGAIAGDRVEGAVANGATAPTTLQLLTLAPRAAMGTGTSSYGLRATNSPGLVVEHVLATAGAGTAGPAGAQGTNGRAAGRGLDGEPGGYDGTGGGFRGGRRFQSRAPERW